MRLSLRVKIISLLIIGVSVVFTILSFQIISREREILQNAFQDKAKILATALDAGIGSYEQLKDVSRVQSTINKFLWLYPELVGISISLPTPEGLKIVASNKTEEIGKSAQTEAIISYQQGKILTKILTLPTQNQVFSAFVPIHIGGGIAGVYEIRLSLETERKAISERQKEIGITILLSTLVIVAFLSLLLNQIVISPIAKIKEGLERIGKGDLNWRIVLRTQDEIGDLARRVNEMVEKLEFSYKNLEKKVKETTEELEEAKTVLEIKVRARTRELRELAESLEAKVKERTKELQKKVEELEKFQRLAVGRELKMIELKKEIERLKNQLQSKK